jgi:hypothetical protein
MLITKTPEFHKKFLYDMIDIAIFSKEYKLAIIDWDRKNQLNTIGYRHQPSRNVKFVGSYFSKDYGKLITDIDTQCIIRSVNDETFYTRLTQILQNLDRTNFKFGRFYCGYVKGLQPPWNIGDSGECLFDAESVDKWLEEVKTSHPLIYEKCKKLTGDTISMADLVEVDTAIDPFISVTWTREDIIRGYKVLDGERYDLKESMINYDRQRVFKYIYKYKNSYCLVDVTLLAKDLSIPKSSKNMVVYYTNNIQKKFKVLKKILNPGIDSEYFKDISKSIGHITPLASAIEMIDKCKKYQIMSPAEITEMERQALEYSKAHKIDTINYKQLQNMISTRLEPLYIKYISQVLPEKKRELYVYDIRTLQIGEKVNKEKIKLRKTLGFDCTLFPINVKHIEYLYDKSLDALLDPYQMYKCITDVCRIHNKYMPSVVENIFTKENYKIISTTEGLFVLLKDKTEIKQSRNLKKLQKIVLTGN